MNIIENSIIKLNKSEEVIKAREINWNIKLPQTYRLFINIYNGCIPENRVFIYKNKEYLVERFLCIMDNYENHKLGIYDIDVVLSQIEDRLTKNEDLVGIELLPIAELFSGDYICLDFKKENPSVCIWSHEESIELNPVLYDICESFEKFIELLI